MKSEMENALLAHGVMVKPFMTEKALDMFYLYYHNEMEGIMNPLEIDEMNTQDVAMGCASVIQEILKTGGTTEEVRQVFVLR